ncbi:MAG: 3-deoxy-7-phosphoheptulonate synthase [Lachnospiraceae bacterium]|nr:3-deoxy-7-phosphoheptulonate synthase [Candidatus Equihabitans merdae]
MIVILKKNPDPEQLEGLVSWLESQQIAVHPTVGSQQTILGLVGDTTVVDIDLIASLDIVDNVKRVQEPYKNANRKFHPEDTVIEVGGVKIGGGSMTLIAGPSSIESEEQIIAIAEEVKAAGAQILRGGAFCPRTSPYSFQGMKGEGIELLLKAKAATGLPIVSEIADGSQLKYFDDVDIIQVGARNMQNYTLLSMLGKLDKPILLKKGLSATYEDLLMSAEYIMAEGNQKVILCERGARTFETYTHSTLDVSIVPALKSMTHLPIILDPSHSAGRSYMVAPLSKASIAVGADGLTLEVHNDPSHARINGPQAITPAAFADLQKDLVRLKSVL